MPRIEYTLAQYLGTQVLKRREELNLTQVELARLSDVSQPHLSKIEQGQGYPSFEGLVGLKRALKVDYNYFFEDSYVDIDSLITNDVAEMISLYNQFSSYGKTMILTLVRALSEKTEKF
jgi:transcriptional regulator with XRE-family HTH domain